MQVPLFLHGLSKHVMSFTEHVTPENPLLHVQKKLFGCSIFSEHIALFLQGFEAQTLWTVDFLSVVVVVGKDVVVAVVFGIVVNDDVFGSIVVWNVLGRVVMIGLVDEMNVVFLLEAK